MHLLCNSMKILITFSGNAGHQKKIKNAFSENISSHYGQEISEANCGVFSFQKNKNS